MLGCDRVTLADCRIHGQRVSWPLEGAPGLALTASQAVVHRSSFRGACDYPRSGAGATVRSSFALTIDTELRGEDGIQGDTCHAFGHVYPSGGGDGVQVLNGAHLVSIGGSITAGPGGTDPCGPSEPDGAAVVVVASTHDVLSSPQRHMSGPSLVQAGDTMTFSFHGEPGDTITLLEGPDEVFQYDANLAGVWQLEPTTSTPTIVGVVGATGTLDHTLAAGLSPGSQHTERRFQMLVRDAAGLSFLGSSHDVAVLNDLGFGLCHPIYYVRKGAGPGSDGRTWATAFGELAEALDAINVAQGLCPGFAPEVWITAGTYTPSPVTLDPFEVFFVRSGTQLYGGFVGIETLRNERDPDLNRTVLSGDLLGNDGPDFSGYADNSASIVFTFDAVLDGLVVRGAWRTAVFNYGGDDLVVRHCEIRENLSNSSGAGFLGNEGNGRQLFVNTLFYRNRADIDGGGLFAPSSAYVVNCRFVENEALLEGGAAWFSDHPFGGVVAGSTFIGNRASTGGAIASQHIVAEFEIVNCSFVANEATATAGGVELDGSQLAVYGSLFWRNAVNGVQDEAAQLAGDQVEIGFSLVQGWTGNLGGVGNFHGNPRFVDMDGPDGMLGNLDDDLRLQPTSVCIDAGRWAALPMDLLDLDGDGDTGELLPVDLDGNARVVGQTRHAPEPSRFRIVDIGAYETPLQ